MMKLLVLPRDPNPYQDLLYGEMKRLGVQISYIGELTPSHIVNLLLLPLELGLRRILGARLVHLHWVFSFSLPGTRRFPLIRVVAQAWFLVWLRMCRMLGMHLVWTVHNVLPHRPVFANDASARRSLVKACDLVLAHSPSALAELSALGASARRTAIIPHGAIVPAQAPAAPQIRCGGDETRRFLFFGRVEEYKGVENLLAAFAAMPCHPATHLTVAGQCDSPGLRSVLCELARRAGVRVTLRLERIPEDEVGELFAAADVVVLPFRRITTSGSAMLALSHGKPLIVPDLPGLAVLPDQALLRYDGKVPALTNALASLACASGATLAAMSAAAYAFASQITWQEIAQQTLTEMLLVLDDFRKIDASSRSAAPS
jgi:glycosyltransferase involved in cell wall biosynthesis